MWVVQILVVWCALSVVATAIWAGISHYFKRRNS